MIGFAIAAVLAASPVGAVPACDLAHLEGCPTTNPLVGDSSFRRALRIFLGSRKATHFYRGSLFDQALDGLGGPPDGPERVGRLYRFTACRAHSCEEKAGIVIEPDGRIAAVALLHSSCVDMHAPPDCFNQQTLTVYVRDQAQYQSAIDDLTRWAREMVADAYVYPGRGTPVFVGTRVVTLEKR